MAGAAVAIATGGAGGLAHAALGAAIKSETPPSNKAAAGISRGYKDEFSRTYETPAGPVNVTGGISFQNGSLTLKDINVTGPGAKSLTTGQAKGIADQVRADVRAQFQWDGPMKGHAIREGGVNPNRVMEWNFR